MVEGVGGKVKSIVGDMKNIPFRSFLRAQPVQALMYTHFCCGWFFST